jgi:ABC-type transport system substrate-binding protein
MGLLPMACSRDEIAPTEAPAEEPTEAPAEEPIVAPAPETEEEPAAEPEEEVMEFEPLSVAADSCDYGGKIESIEATDEHTVQWNLCKPDPAFLAKVAFTPFGVLPQEFLEATGGGGEELNEKPIGTGPYMVDEWIRGDSLILTRFEDYWREGAPAETAVYRWNQEGAARLVELQAGTVDFITNVSPDDYEAVESDPNLVLVPQDSPNILYLAMTNTFEPFNDPLVRQAIAMGVDRQRIVDNFYPEGSEVASHFTPCSIPNGCEGEEWYEFDPGGARALLAEAGYGDGFETSIFYRDVFTPYLPEPSLVAAEFQDQLREILGIEAEPARLGRRLSARNQLPGLPLHGHQPAVWRYPSRDLRSTGRSFPDRRRCGGCPSL